MPFNPAIRDALSVTGDKSATATRDAIEREHAWVCPNGFDVTDFVPGLTRVIVFAGRVFARDDADTTTPHDGLTTLVTQGGVRFKADGFGSGPIIRRYAVISRLSAPPGSPAVGDAHIVTAPGTGAFATHVNKVATWTAAGWRFVVPRVYDEAHVSAEALIYHFNASSVWTQGSPAIVIADNSLLFTKLKHGLGLAVENQTTNTPPVSPSDGVAYIIGGSPTGAWAGHAFKIAYREAGAWLIVSPQIGWQVYDKNITAGVVYAAAGWVSLVAGYSAATSIFTAASLSGSMPISGNYSYLPTTAPTTASNNTDDPAILTYAAKRSGAVLEVHYNCSMPAVTGGANMGMTIGLQVDSSAAMTDWNVLNNSGSTSLPGISAAATFFVTTSDTLAHDYRIRFFPFNTSSSPNFNFSRRRLIIRERA